MKYLMLMLMLFSGINRGMAQTAKEMQLTANVSESGCAGTNHTVAVQAHGGKEPYTYTWSDGRSGRFRNDLKGGTYTCTVSDSSGKIAKKTFTLSQLPQELTATARQEKAGDKTLVQIDARGGKAPYKYIWLADGITPEKSNQPNKQFTPGRYEVMVQDMNGCFTRISFTTVK